MSKRDEVIEQIALLVLPYIESCGFTGDALPRAKTLAIQILAIDGIAVVDREAKEPELFPSGGIDQGVNASYLMGWSNCAYAFRRASWVKELQDAR